MLFKAITKVTESFLIFFFSDQANNSAGEKQFSPFP